MKNYDERSVANHLNRFTNVSVVGKSVTIPRSGIGIHTAGKVDFLVNHCGYVLQKR